MFSTSPSAFCIHGPDITSQKYHPTSGAMGLWPAAGISDLPLELLLEISSYLTPSSLIALKLASKQFYATTPAPLGAWYKIATDCEKAATHRTIQERTELIGGRRKCIMCGILAPVRRFSGDAPICKWHQARFMSSSMPEYLENPIKIQLLLMTRQAEDAVWIPVTRYYCAHEREVIGWHISTCTCACNSCGLHKVTCLVRVSPKMDTPQMSTPTDDGQFVSEEHWMPQSSSWPVFVRPRDVLGEPLVAYRTLKPVIHLS